MFSEPKAPLRLAAALAALLVTVAIGSAALTSVAEAAGRASCFGKRAEIVRQTGGSYDLKRFRSVLFTGTNLTVRAAGDNQVCIGNGNVRVLFGKGKTNSIEFGSGQSSVVFQEKAIRNIVRTRGGDNRITFRAKASKNEVIGSARTSSILVANKSNETVIDIANGDNRIDYAAKSSSQDIRTGVGNDELIFRAAAKTFKRSVRTGLGNDRVRVIAQGNTTAYLSDQKNPLGLADTDSYIGGASNDIVYDYFGGSKENPNRIDGGGGFDRIFSLGSAHSIIRAGTGTDYIYAASAGEAGDRIFGGRGNDKIYANRGSGPGVKGAFLDPGVGDDWIYGTSERDTVIALSGIKKIDTGAGDDLILKTGDGLNTIEGGPGRDTISYAAHTPPGYRGASGVWVDLGEGKALNGKGVDTISSIEHLIGSPFDDELIASPSRGEDVEGGLGDDIISGFSGDRLDGGLGENICTGSASMTQCNDESPGQERGDFLLADIGEDGILTLIGSNRADDLTVSYDPAGSRYLIKVDSYAHLSRDCRWTNQELLIECPARFEELSILSVNGGSGSDNIEIDYSVPSDVNTILNAGPGNNRVLGGQTADFITSGAGRSDLYGRDGSDQLFLVGDGTTNGGAGDDLMNVEEVCIGGQISGGSGKDNAVFAGARRGVSVNLRLGRASWFSGGCAQPLRLVQDFEDAEGSRHPDEFFSNRSRSTGFLGREGNDVYWTKNGVKDSVITGSGRDKISRDPIDKIVYGWGLAEF